MAPTAARSSWSPPRASSSLVGRRKRPRVPGAWVTYRERGERWRHEASRLAAVTCGGFDR
uniref:Uncharacterized protein n=1 Tax=Aegilops tauschii subsp. strangulata TaxID=200361 RepID=A0A452ZCM9_AEGTS